jgi:hypothetical protein
MAEKLDPEELVTFKELLMSEVIQSEALINLLDRKGTSLMAKFLNHEVYV